MAPVIRHEFSDEYWRAQGRREAIAEVVAFLREWASEVKNWPDYVEALRDAADDIEEKFT